MAERLDALVLVGGQRAPCGIVLHNGCGCGLARVSPESRRIHDITYGEADFGALLIPSQLVGWQQGFRALGLAGELEAVGLHR